MVGSKIPNMKHLDWSHLFMSDAGLAWLGAGAPRLVTLKLDGCHQVTDDGVVAIADCCYYLTEIDLSGCVEVTDRAITAFTSYSLKQRRIEKVLNDRDSVNYCDYLLP